MRQAEAELAAAESALAQQEAAYKLAHLTRRPIQAGQIGRRLGTAGKQAETTAETRRRWSTDTTACGIGASRGLPGESVAVQPRDSQSQEPSSGNRSRNSRRRSQAPKRRRRRPARAYGGAGEPARSATSARRSTARSRRGRRAGRSRECRTAIVTLLDLSKVYLRGFVPEGQIGRVKWASRRVFTSTQPRQSRWTRTFAHRSAGHIHARKTHISARPREAGGRRKAAVEGRDRIREAGHARRWRNPGRGDAGPEGTRNRCTRAQAFHSVPSPDLRATQPSSADSGSATGVEAVRGIDLEIGAGRDLRPDRARWRRQNIHVSDPRPA